MAAGNSCGNMLTRAVSEDTPPADAPMTMTLQGAMWAFTARNRPREIGHDCESRQIRNCRCVRSSFSCNGKCLAVCTTRRLLASLYHP
jgi:hypothetical protein